MAIELIEDILGNMEGGFRVKWNYVSYFTDVTVWKILGIDVKTDAPAFQRRDANFRPDEVDSTDDAERYLLGSIKSVGCTDFRFWPDSNGYVHWRGPEDIKKHFQLLEYLYRRSRDLLIDGDPEWAQWDNT